MNDLNIDYINDILSTSIVSYQNLIGETLFVNSNPAKVESIEVKKIDNNIVRSKTINEYKLNSTTIETKNINNDVLIFSILSILDSEFLKSLNILDSDKLEFYKKGIYKLFVKTNPQTIIDEIGEYHDWIITSSKVYKHLSKHKKFISLSDEKSTSIKLKGRIDNLNVFITDIDRDTIYIGSCKETSSVMLSELNITQENVKVDYLFINKGIRKLILV
jgi:hypothetical protein